VSLRNYAEANVVIEDSDSGEVLGELNRFDAPPILHPEAIYMHQGDMYRVLTLDLERNRARVRREEVDYYTQPLGGTDVHHIDQQLRDRPFGSGRLCWGEVTAYFRTCAFEKVHFYSLDAISTHSVELPTMVLETTAFWLISPATLMEQVRQAGLDAHSGLRAVGYATRMLLPLFITCDTLDFSHTVGSANSPWNTIFVYERYPHGLGFTEKAYEQMHRILPAVRDHIANCPCQEGCPCCVGKPLRQYATWNVERGEASIPSKAAARMILDGLLGDGTNLQQPDTQTLADTPTGREQLLEPALRRRLERGREPQVFHRIRPEPEVTTQYPHIEARNTLAIADVARRAQRGRDFDRDLHRRIAKHIRLEGLAPDAAAASLPKGMKKRRSNLPPTSFSSGQPACVRRSPLAGARAKTTTGRGSTAGRGEQRPPCGRAGVQPECGEHGSGSARLAGNPPAPPPRRERSALRDATTAVAGCDVTRPESEKILHLGDALAARARKLVQNRKRGTEH
jgi:hypothetical protein